MGKEGIATLLLPKNDPKKTLQISQLHTTKAKT